MSGRNGLRVRGEIQTGWEGPGGYMGAKVQKLEQQFQQDAEGRQQLSGIFRGVAIQVDGYTNPSADELKVLMSKHGGKFHMYYSRVKTTHVIACNLPHSKRKELRPDQKVVKPQWIVDSLSAKQLLPIEPYLVVALDNGSQSRISSLLGKQRSTDSDKTSTCLSISDTGSSASTSSNELSHDQSKSENLDITKDIVSNKTLKPSSSSMCPTTDSNFLNEFYSHSRLHFLSTWKMELTEYVRSLQSEESLNDLPLSGYEKLLEIAKTEGQDRTDHGRAVMHIDMDCFFVSVGLISRPELKGLPVAVTHSSGAANTRERPGTDFDYEKQFYANKFGNKSNPGNQKQHSDDDTEQEIDQNKSSSSIAYSTSTVASCSYEARAVGIKNGMFFGSAKKLCPQLRVIPYDFEAYRTASQQLYSTIASYTRHIEAVSCDETIVDITKLVKDSGLSPIRIASCMRQSVKEATHCNASAGVGPNIALARMATRRAKPDGEFAVTAQDAKEFMKSLPVKDLPGVGHSTASRLQELNLPTCGDLQKFSIQNLKQEFGNKTGQKLHDMSCGIDLREVQNDKERKSVSADVNYGIRLSNEDEAKTFLQNLAQVVTNRLKTINMRGRRVTLKIMTRRADAPKESAKFGGHGVCDTSSRSSQIPVDKLQGPVSDEDTSTIYEHSWSILKSLKVNVEDLRGIGIQVTQLQSTKSGTVRSSEAAFLKKFMVKKSDIQTSSTEHADIALLPSTEPDQADAASTHAKEEHKQDADVLNSSFLDALPPDLRKEVVENLVQQKQALERNYQHEESSASTTIQIPDEPMLVENIPNILFCGGGKLTGGSRAVVAARGSKVTRGRGRGKRGGSSSRTKSQKTSVSKTSNRKSSSTSPNKLITDMFPVTYSPRKISSGRNSPLNKKGLSPMRVTALKDQSTSSSNLHRARRKLIPITEETPIQISDSEEEIEEPTEPNRVNENDLNSKETVPSLGGAVTIQDLREVLDEWISSCVDEGPLDCDVDDFISFLCQTATKVRDLEKVHLVLRSLRRKLDSIFRNMKEKQSSNGKMTEIIVKWTQIYENVCKELQMEIREAYSGGELIILSL